MSDKRDKLKRLFAQDKTPQTEAPESVPVQEQHKPTDTPAPEPDLSQPDEQPTRGRGVRGRNYGVKTGTHAQLKVILERETYDRFKRYLLEQQLVGNEVNGSEVIEDLLKAFLDKQDEDISE